MSVFASGVSEDRNGCASEESGAPSELDPPEAKENANMGDEGWNVGDESMLGVWNERLGLGAEGRIGVCEGGVDGGK